MSNSYDQSSKKVIKGHSEEGQRMNPRRQNQQQLLKDDDSRHDYTQSPQTRKTDQSSKHNPVKPEASSDQVVSRSRTASSSMEPSEEIPARNEAAFTEDRGKCPAEPKSKQNSVENKGQTAAGKTTVLVPPPPKPSSPTSGKSDSSSKPPPTSGKTDSSSSKPPPPTSGKTDSSSKPPPSSGKSDSSSKPPPPPTSGKTDSSSKPPSDQKLLSDCCSCCCSIL